jgi:hypothetical protein
MYVYVAVYLVGNIHEERSIQVISSMLVELRNGRISIYVEDVSLNIYSYPHTKKKKRISQTIRCIASPSSHGYDYEYDS